MDSLGPCSGFSPSLIGIFRQTKEYKTTLALFCQISEVWCFRILDILFEKREIRDTDPALASSDVAPFPCLTKAFLTQDTVRSER